MTGSSMSIALLTLLASILIQGTCGTTDAEGNVVYRLHNRRYPEGASFRADQGEDRLLESGKGCIFIIHGWTQSHKDQTIADSTEELWRNKNINTITVDWSDHSKIPYTEAINRTGHVGEELAKELLRLHRSKSCTLDSTHLVGHSLGAHVAGIAGHKLRAMSGLQVARITGLDPAGPAFKTRALEDKLDRSDAKFVMNIYTSGTLGLQDHLAHADFYPNGGILQPGCLPLVNSCSHTRSVDYFMESITNSNAFLSTKCGSYSDFIRKKCQGNEVVPMGLYTPTSARGTYYLTTNSKSPYSK